MAIAGVGSAILVYLFAKPLLSLYINDNPAAIESGIERLAFVCLPYFLCGLMEVTTGAIRGVGVSVVPMIISIVGVCVLRIVWVATVFAMVGTLASLLLCYSVTWAITFTAQFIAFSVIYKRKKAQYELNQIN